MIFRFTEEEKAEIRAFEEKKKANGITWEDFTARVKAINDKYGEGRGPFDKEKLEFLENEKQEMDYAYIDFVVLMDKFEENRFQDLKTQTKIIADAKKITEEVLIFHYNSYLPEFKKIEDQLAENPIMNIGWKGYNLHFSILLHDGANALFDLIEQKDQEPIFLFNGSSVYEYLKKSALEEHFKRLKGTPGEKELDEAIKAILFKSNMVHKKGIHESANDNKGNVKKVKRTEAKAKEAGAITEGPKSLITPTMSNYQYSMSLYQGGSAYLQPLSSMDNLKFDNGKLYFSDGRAREVSEAELRDLRTKEGIEELDLTNLRYYYSILFDEFQRSDYKVLQDIIVVSVPLLAGRKDPKERDVNAIIKNLQSYHNVMGVIKSMRNGKERESYYQVLNFEYYDESHNIVAFSSPYMNYVIQNMYNLSVKRENGQPKLTKSGKPITLPIHSYLIDESIRKERNKAAVENVILLVALIEQAGNNEPHIKASTLIERNVQFAERLKVTENPRMILKRVFVKTWELLRTKTRLEETYINIKLPDPKDPAYIPAMGNLNEIVFRFPHEGKKV